MKILWVKTDFLHPTTKGGRIRTLEIVRRLHRRHEIHYVAFDSPAQPDGLARSAEYCARAYPVPHRVPERNSLAFAAQLAAGLFSDLPLAISRYRSSAMRDLIANLLAREKFDRLVCDFLTPSVNIPDMSKAVLFQHNVETAIWRRHARHSPGLARGSYFSLQAVRMLRYERMVCRSAAHVVAVSSEDAGLMRKLFGVSRLSVAPTGVDVGYFLPRDSAAPVADLVFVGSMDWLPNIDGVTYFVREILPLIRRRRPDCSLAVVGRQPAREISALSLRDPLIHVTGTVPDVRPYLWGSSVSIVPIRIGGGTRLKIYESMAARLPVVSTTVGAEGLDVSSPENIRLADDPERFAACCLELLEDAAARSRLAEAAWRLVASRFSWDRAADCFERILQSAVGFQPQRQGDPGALETAPSQ